MKTIKEEKNIQVTTLENAHLDKYDGNVLFAKKIKKAKATLAKAGLPKIKR